MKKVAIIHYMPLEYYPPVTNFLDIFSIYKNNRVHVFSTKNNKERKVYENSCIERICRSSFPTKRENSIRRMLKYFMFNVSCFFKLVKFQPNSIFYYESYSAWPVYWYLRLFGNKINLFIHYHEYTSPSEYLNGMRLVKIYHQYEQNFLYKKARWISHTNQQRIDLFLKDIPEVDSLKMKVLPNYPPDSWLKKERLKTARNEIVLRTVYVGSLSLSDTFIKEYCEWVMAQNGKVIFHIYSYNLHHDTEVYLDNLNSEHIIFIKGGVEYGKMPQLLNKYDIGVILYKALTSNYEYNAPNKLFEYMACGLEIWFSDKMKGCYPYKRHVFPRILPVDFERINSLELLSGELQNASYVPHPPYTADNALKPLIEKLQE